MKNKLNALEMELALTGYLNSRENLIVPNVSWGMFHYECDLIVMTKAGYLWEIEIKVSRSDLIADKKKEHGHRNGKVKHLYFAIPDYLVKDIEHIPERAGIIEVYSETHQVVRDGHELKDGHRGTCSIIRKPAVNCLYKLSDAERYKIARLGALRIWGLKRTIQNIIDRRKGKGELEEEIKKIVCAVRDGCQDTPCKKGCEEIQKIMALAKEGWDKK